MDGYLLYVLVLRLLHIFGGVFWAGAALVVSGFVEPTAQALGPDGGKFMNHMMGRTRWALAMALSSLCTTVAGVLLFWRVSGGFQAAWIMSPAGLALTIGSLAGIVEFFQGNFVVARTAGRLAQLGQAIESAGGPPQPEQLAELHRLQEKLRVTGKLGALLLSIAVISMALARYL